MSGKDGLLADENISRALVRALIKDVKEEKMQGASDSEIMDLAKKEARIVLTHDKDFANMLHGKPVDARIILLRFSGQSPRNVIARFVPVFMKQLKERKFGFVIVSENYVWISGG